MGKLGEDGKRRELELPGESAGGRLRQRVS